MQEKYLFLRLIFATIQHFKRIFLIIKQNGVATSKNWLSDQKLMKGSIIEIKMSAQPNKKRGVNDSDAPFSLTK